MRAIGSIAQKHISNVVAFQRRRRDHHQGWSKHKSGTRRDFCLISKFDYMHEMTGPIECPSRARLALLRNYAYRAIRDSASSHVAVSVACLQSKDLPQRARARVIPNPISDVFESVARSPSMSSRKVDVLFVGRVIESKGVMVLVDALGMIASNGTALNVKIVGDGPALPTARAKLSQYERLSVNIAGVETGMALAASYLESKILVVPSIEPEGQGLVAVEGLAFGLPVIASDDAALKEVIGEAGVVVPKCDASAIATALESLLKDRIRWGSFQDGH